jgi:hypothetical protein
MAYQKGTALGDFNLFMRQVRQQGFRVHVGVLHIRLSMSLTSFSKRAVSGPLLASVARSKLGKAGCWWDVGGRRSAVEVALPPVSLASEGLGASGEPHGPVDHLSETTGSTLHKGGALVEKKSLRQH